MCKVNILVHKVVNDSVPCLQDRSKDFMGGGVVMSTQSQASKLHYRAR